jgi:hypothetical protein
MLSIFHVLIFHLSIFGDRAGHITCPTFKNCVVCFLIKFWGFFCILDISSLGNINFFFFFFLCSSKTLFIKSSGWPLSHSLPRIDGVRSSFAGSTPSPMRRGCIWCLCGSGVCMSWESPGHMSSKSLPSCRFNRLGQSLWLSLYEGLCFVEDSHSSLGWQSYCEPPPVWWQQEVGGLLGLLALSHEELKHLLPLGLGCQSSPL